MRRGFVERTVESLREAAERSLFSEQVARQPGPLQSVDPRVKAGVALLLIVTVIFVHDLRFVSGLLLFSFLLALSLGRTALQFLTKAWLVGLTITVVAALPAIVLTPGEAVLALPMGLEVTRQGVRSVAFLLGRVGTATTLSLVLVLSTRWAELLRSLRLMGVPSLLIAIVGMTYRYVFVVLEIAGELFDGRRSRRVGALAPAAERRLAGATAGALLTRTLRLTDEVWMAMQSRGFRGEVRVLRDPHMRVTDWFVLLAFVLAAGAVMMVGR